MAFFLNFFRTYRRTAIPASEKTVALYVAYLDRTLQFTTIKNYVASIASLHHYRDTPSPNLSYCAIREALAGVQRARRKLPNKRTALFPEYLLRNQIEATGNQ